MSANAASYTTTTGLGLNRSFVTSVPGILKMIQIVMILICLLCNSIALGKWRNWAGLGGGWMQFWIIFSLCVIGVIFFMFLLNLIFKLPATWPLPLILLVVYCFLLVLWIISFIVLVVRASQYDGKGTIKATAAFCFFVSLAVVVDIFFFFRNWRANEVVSGTSNRQQSTATTSQTVVTQQQLEQY